MKKFLFVALSLLALPSVASAANVPAGGATFDFAAIPAATDFSTRTTALTGDGTTVSDNATMDTLVQARAIGDIVDVMTSTVTNPPSANIAARFNGNNFALQTQATTTPATLLLGRFVNTTNATMTSLAVNYDLTQFLDAAEVAAEEIPGHRVYFSSTGAVNSWTPIGNFGTAGPVAFNVPGLNVANGANYYLLWADDNAIAGTTAGEVAYNIDNLHLVPTTTAPVPDFGTVTPPQSQNFEGGGGLTVNAPGATTVALAGSNALQNNSTSVVNATSQVINLQSTPAGRTVNVSADFKAWETSAGSDFEPEDRIALIAEYSTDGLTFTPFLTVVDLHGATWSGTDGVVAPGDQLRNTFGPDAATNTATQPFVHFASSAVLPAGAQAMRVVAVLGSNSTSEFTAVDNINVSIAPVPEPASVAMIGLGLVGLVGYGVRRRRSA